MNNHFFLSIILFLLPFLSDAQPTGALYRLLNADGMKNAAVGVSVKRVSDGKTVTEFQPEMALSPASVMKLITTALALKEKGSHYKYNTLIGYRGKITNGILTGDIVVEATGDPCFDSRYFPEYELIKSLTAAIKEAGIKKIEGRVIIRGCEKDEISIPGSWAWEDISNYYGAQHHLFNYRDNSYTLEFRSGDVGSPVELVSVFPVQSGIEFRNEVVASLDNADNAYIMGGPYSRVMCVKGTIPGLRNSFKIKGVIHDPAQCFIDELEDQLKQKGIVVQNRILSLTEPVKQLLLRISPALEKIVYYTNKRSVNLFAEALGKLMADDYPQKVVACLKTIGSDASGCILKDACGLSPLNAVPATVFTDLLVWAHSRLGEPFIASLPVAGIDGGLNGYYGGDPLLKNNLKAKTGSFSGVRCLSGYFSTRSGELLAFTILINHYTCPTSRLQQLVKEFLQEQM